METDNVPPSHHSNVWHASLVGRAFTRIQAWFLPARLASRHDPDSTKMEEALCHQNNSVCVM